MFGARSPRLGLKTDDSVCVREHLILLLMSMVTCGRFTAKLGQGSLDVPAYLHCIEEISVSTRGESTDDIPCPGEMVLVDKTGLVSLHRRVLLVLLLWVAL